MMILNFRDKTISGILTIVPENKVKFADEIDNYEFSKEKCLNLQKVIGIDERRIVTDGECATDLCLYGLQYLVDNGYLEKDDISAVIFVTQTPDHFMPPNSAIIHGELGLNSDVLCFDITYGCSGYIYGLLQAFMMLESVENGKIILLNGDTLSRCTCKYDRNIYPLIGDAGAVTIIEKSPNDNTITIDLKMDGSRRDWLMIPAGAFRIPPSDETRKIKTLPDGNKRSDGDFYMNGSGIFTFTQTDVPETIHELFETAGMTFDDIDYFMFHQPNRFMINKLASKLKIPKEKMPGNIVEKFGNSSSVTIPLNICYNISEEIKKKELKLCLSGYGVGLSWGGLIMNAGHLDFCEIIEK